VQLHELIEFVIGGDWGKSADYGHDDWTDVYCIRGTELRDWKTDRGRTAAHRRIKSNSLSKRRLEEGDLILEVSGGGPEQPVGRVELIDRQVLNQNSQFPKVCTNFFRRLKPCSEIDAPFLVWYLKFFYQTGEIKKYQAGSNNLRNLKYPEYEKVSIPLPPRDEQRRIVEKIETLFARLDQGEAVLRQVQTALARYRQSVLKAAVTGQLTADWRAANADRLEPAQNLLDRILQTRRETWQGRGKYKEPVAPDTTDLPELPEGWVWASVDQILRAPLSNGRSVPDAEQGFPVLRLTALKDGDIDIAERKVGAWDADTARPFLIEEGDVLVSRGNGSKQLVGRGGLVRLLPLAVAYPDTMIRIPIAKASLSPEWFLQLWNSPLMRQQIEKAAKTTAGIYKINQSDIRGFHLPVPPIEKQRAIEEIVNEKSSKVQNLEIWCQSELTRSIALRQSILKQAFAGRLVPQDPNDEPASELLARIRANQASTPKKKTTPRKGKP
jgi:type I restriction enzyme S subunit